MTQNSNFDIPEQTSFNVQEGFVILTPSPVLIPWKTDLRVLLFNYPDFVTEENGLTIVYPIQIGKIIVKEKIIYKKQGWSLPLFISGKEIAPYEKVKTALDVMMKGEGLSKDEHKNEGTTRFYVTPSKLAFRLDTLCRLIQAHKFRLQIAMRAC